MNGLDAAALLKQNFNLLESEPLIQLPTGLCTQGIFLMIAETQNIGECLDEAALAKADFEKVTREKAVTPAKECKELAEEAAEKPRYLTGQIQKADQAARYAKQAAEDFAYYGDSAFASFAARNAADASNRAARLRLRLAEEKVRAKQYKESCQALLLESRVADS